MSHGVLLPNQEQKLQQLIQFAGETTDPDKGTRKSQRAVIEIEFYDGYPRTISLKITERLQVPEEYKKNPL